MLTVLELNTVQDLSWKTSFIEINAFMPTGVTGELW